MADPKRQKKDFYKTLIKANIHYHYFFVNIPRSLIFSYILPLIIL